VALTAARQQDTGGIGSEGWEAPFRLVFEQTTTPVALVDEQRRCLDINVPMECLFRCTRAGVQGRSLTDSLTGSERARSAREWREFLSSGSYSGRRSLSRADGTTVDISFTAVLAHVDGGRVAVYTATPLPDGREGAVLPLGPAASRLTRREREVVELIGAGSETPEIAVALRVAPNTVRTHVRNAMAKLWARTRAQLVALALGGATPPANGR